MGRIDRLLAGGGVRAVHRAIESGHTGMPRDASLMDQPRLIICLKGRVDFELKLGAKGAKVTLGARDGLFAAAGRWVRARSAMPYTSMGVVFYPDATRFYLMQAQPTPDGHPGMPVETHIVPAGIADSGRALSRILSSSPPASEGGRFLHHAFECLLILSRDLLAQPAGLLEGGKARYTWQAACDFMMENLHRPLSRKDVARHLGVHPNHLSRLFAEFGRESFSQFLLARRLDRARLLMEDPGLNIAEVARLGGFGSANYFTRVFRAQTGRTPTHARVVQSRHASPK